MIKNKFDNIELLVSNLAKQIKIVDKIKMPDFNCKIIVIEGIDYSGKDTFIHNVLVPLLSNTKNNPEFQNPDRKPKIKVIDYHRFKTKALFNNYNKYTDTDKLNKIKYMHTVVSRFISLYGKFYDYIILNRSYISMYVYQTMTINSIKLNDIINYIDNQIQNYKYYIPHLIIYLKISDSELRTRISRRVNSENNDAFDTLVEKNYMSLMQLYHYVFSYFKHVYRYYKIKGVNMEYNNIKFTIDVYRLKYDRNISEFLGLILQLMQ